MRLRDVARICLCIAAIALISLKAVMIIGPEGSFPTILSAPDQSAVVAETTTIAGGPVNVVQTQQALPAAMPAPADCVPCNQAAAQQEGCPGHCECLTDEEAEQRGLSLCDDERTECIVYWSPVAAPVWGHCYQIAEEAKCPNHCVCLPVVEGEAAGYRLCNGIVIECAPGTRAEHRCYEVRCPDGCVCVTHAAASAMGYPGLCQDVQTLCGYDVDGTPEYCYTERAEDDPIVCRDADISLRQVRLDSGQIRFIVDVSCPITRVQLMVDGIVVKECEGRYCEYYGGPYPAREFPSFSAILLDHLDDQIGSPSFQRPDITVSMPADVPWTEFDPCPLCPDPEPQWGECLSHTCDGNDHFQAYDWTSNVQLTGCFYENYSLTGGLPIYLGEGLLVETQIAEPFFDYCIDDNSIVLHRCRNDFVSRYTYTCPYGCYNGMCICATSDGGINPYERGWVLYGTNGYVPGAMDYCIDERTLREFYTEIDFENNRCTIKWIDFECPGECRDGACHGTCFDGIQNQGELGIDCGGPCLAACEHDIGWYAQNYGFKFENPPGQNLSYGSCWSKSRRCTTGYGHYKGTFGNCEVCICHCFGCCCGWHIHAGVYYPIYRYGGASQGQCTGMCLSSLAFYYGDRQVKEYDPLASEVIHLNYAGILKDHIASRQGKVVSKENIAHYLMFSDHWGANDVLRKVENSLSKDPPDYGMIFMIEDDGWGGWRNTVRRSPLGHTVIATSVVYVDSDIARIYIYDPNVPVAENPTPNSPYFNVDRSPYIEIHKPSNTYTFYGPDPADPVRDSDGQLWSNANDELFDRIGYMPYSKLAGDVDVPLMWDVVVIGIVGALGAADAQVEDSQGRVLGFSEDGPEAPAITDAMILPSFGDPQPGSPTVFALPIGDYRINIRGTSSGSYSAYILGDSHHAFSISDVAVSEGTRDTISVQYAHGEAVMSFTTLSGIQGPVEMSSIYVDEVTEISYRVVRPTISYGSEVSFRVDRRSHSLVFTNYGDSPVTYSVQIYSSILPTEVTTQGMAQQMSTHQSETVHDCTGGCVGASTATGAGANGPPAYSGSDSAGDLAALIEGIQITEVYTFTVEPMERHIVAPEDWSDLPGSQIRVTRQSISTSRWPLIAGIAGAVVAIAVVAVALLSRRRDGSAKTTQ